MELLPLVCLCLLSCSGDAVRVLVKEDSEAVLPCLVSDKRNLAGQAFEWKKDGRKEVFLYDAGIHYNNGRPGQDEQFKGRVSFFQNQLQNGDASIKISNTKVTDSGNYSCIFPRLQSEQTSIIELVVDPRDNVTVKEDDDAVLPCLISTKEDLSGKLFDWRKDESQTKKEVFMYNAGIHYNNGLPGQDQQFIGRVSHFQDQLQNGNASIKITRTMMADSGIYSCIFPRLQSQTFYIKLIVDPVLRDRTGEKPGAASKPSITTFITEEGVVLQCGVRGASPKPKVEWKDGSGNILPVKDQKETESGGRYDIILQTAVTKSSIFRCVVTQEEISHQTEAEIYAFHGAAPEPAVRVLVKEDSDVVLPCLISDKRNLAGQAFDWRKDGREEVFLYDAGNHYNNGRPGQDEQFKGRVSFFLNQLQNGDASIKIRNTKVTDSGNYSCIFPRLQRQTFHIELVVDPAVRVLVEQDSEAVLPCLISTKQNLTGKLFDWKKDGQKEVFMYDSGRHYNNGRHGQDKQFKGRVSHFQDQLKNGNASIKITRTKMADSGIYSCIFPRLQTFYIKLVVGAAPKPYIHTLRDTKDWTLLQCEARGDPPLTVEWKDSAGKILENESTPKSERSPSYITLNITVTKTDTYRCVATQETLNHQIFAETSVYIQGAAPEPGSNTGTIVAAVFGVIILVLVVVIILQCRRSRSAAANRQTNAELSIPMNNPSEHLEFQTVLDDSENILSDH